MPIITPPFRTSLLTQNGIPFGSDSVQTTKDWWLYWNQLTDRSNSNSKLASAGTHGDRPNPDGMPEGALYYENDRGVLYANAGGHWQYVAGTMWGTAGGPDQRPTDLDAADVGFDFRTNVSPAREFIWSGGRWIEVTPMLYGTHAQRIAGTITDLWAGMAWMETDRGNVIYQNQSFLWIYAAGVMVATLASRPADLGPNDTGFRFESTDTRQSFRWSGSAWVETTGVGGAINLTHPNVVTKVGSTTGQIVEGGITDLSAGNSGMVNITAAGSVGLGTASPSSLLHAHSTSGTGAPTGITVSNGADLLSCYRFYRDNAATGYLIFQGEQSAPYSGYMFRVNTSTEVMRITNGGFIGIGVTPVWQLQLSLDSAAKPGTSTWAVSSDIRLKENIEPVKDDSLAILGALNWVRYDYNGQANTPRGLKAIGLSAQDLTRHLPEAVRSSKAKLQETDADEIDVLAIDYHHILVHSARAIQQLDAEVTRLKALIEKPQP